MMFLCYNSTMSNQEYIPGRIYVKLPRRVALALRTLTQSQTGELTDPRKVVSSLIEDAMIERGLIVEKELEEVADVSIP